MIWKLAAVFSSVAAMLVLVTVAAAREHPANEYPPPKATLDLDPADVAGLLKQLYGIEVSPESCLRSNGQGKCPRIARFKLSIGEPGEGVGFGELKAQGGPKSMRSGPNVSALRRPASHNIPPGYACATHADNPRNLSYSSSQGIDYHVAGKSVNSCRFFVGVSRMEVTSTLQRLESGSWVTRAEAGNYAWMSGGDLEADADFNCNHSDSRSYRTIAFSWAIVNGNGYGAANESSTVGKTCPDSF